MGNEMRRLIEQVRNLNKPIIKEDTNDLNYLRQYVNSLPKTFPSIVNNFLKKFGGDGEMALESALDYVTENGDTIISSNEEHNKIKMIIDNNIDTFNSLIDNKFPNSFNLSK